MDTENQAKWERFLDPEALRPNLILASIDIAAFEVLKNSIIERIRDFYIQGFDQDGWTIMPEEENVLSKDRGLTCASLKWLKESEAINDDDLEKFNRIKEHRNFLAHGITKMLIDVALGSGESAKYYIEGEFNALGFFPVKSPARC